MIIVRLLSPEPVGWLCHHQLYSGVGADIVMESITLIDPANVGFECKRRLQKLLSVCPSLDPTDQPPMSFARSNNGFRRRHGVFQRATCLRSRAFFGMPRYRARLRFARSWHRPRNSFDLGQ